MERLGGGETFGRVMSGYSEAAVTLSQHASAAATHWHNHSSPYVCAVIGGGFLHKRERRELEARPGALIPIAAGEPHSDQFGDDGALCVNLFFDQDFKMPPAAWLASTSLRDLLAEIAAELARGKGRDALTLESLSAEIQSEISAPPEARRENQAVRAVIEAIEDAPDRDWTLTELAALASRRPSCLARSFRRHTGRTIGDWRRRRRLTHLCIDLRMTRAPLADLAHRYGFSDQAHMTRSVRAFAGVTPAAFRRLNA